MGDFCIQRLSPLIKFKENFTFKGKKTTLDISENQSKYPFYLLLSSFLSPVTLSGSLVRSPSVNERSQVGH